MNGNIAVLTDTKDFEIFELVNADFYFEIDKTKIREQFYMLVKKYGLIIVPESVAKLLEDDIKEYENKVYPTIFCLPSSKMDNGYAVKRLAKKARTSLGIEI